MKNNTGFTMGLNKTTISKKGIQISLTDKELAHLIDMAIRIRQINIKITPKKY